MSRILDATGFVSEGDFTEGAGQWQAKDAMGVELETAEFLYGLVRMMKPGLVVETGTFPGVATEGIWRAVQDNDCGWFSSWETNPDRAVLAREAFPKVDIRDGSPRDFSDADLVFLDSQPTDRLEEIAAWDATARQGSVVVIHDARHNFFSAPRNAWGFPIRTPRGVWIGAKP